MSLEPSSPTNRKPSGWSAADALIGLGLAGFTLLAHPIASMMRRPYWVDEAWVAALTRISWSSLPSFNSSTPIGWISLLRLVPGPGLRSLVLAFTVGGVIAAFVITRQLVWPSRRSARVAAAMVALVVASVPVALVRNDLKQYTADAFFALVLLGVGRSVERDDGPWAVIRLAVVAVVAVPFSTTSAFVSIAVLVGVLTSSLLARDLRRARATLAVGSAVAVAFSLYFIVFVFPSDTPLLRVFWRNRYLDTSPWRMSQQAWQSFEKLQNVLAMPAPVAIALFVLAVVMLARRRELTMAIALPVLWIEMIALGMAREYPFLDQRTSHFLLIPSIAVVAIGVVDVLFGLARHRPKAAVSATFAIALAFGLGVQPWWRNIGILNEDVRTSTQYVAEQLRPGDVVVVNLGANWGFAYYWPHSRVIPHRRRDLDNGFAVTVRNLNAIYARGRSDKDVRVALLTALDRQRSSGKHSRLFIVRSRMSEQEATSWVHAFTDEHVTPRVAMPGIEPPLVIDPPT